MEQITPSPVTRKEVGKMVTSEVRETRGHARHMMSPQGNPKSGHRWASWPKRHSFTYIGKSLCPQKMEEWGGERWADSRWWKHCHLQNKHQGPLGHTRTLLSTVTTSMGKTQERTCIDLSESSCYRLQRKKALTHNIVIPLYTPVKNTELNPLSTKKKKERKTKANSMPLMPWWPGRVPQFLEVEQA